MSLEATRTMRGRAPARSTTPPSTAAMRVAVVRGRDAGKFVVVPSTPGDKVTVGAGSGNDLVLHDERVSPRHLEVGWVPEGVLLRDLKRDRLGPPGRLP